MSDDDFNEGFDFGFDEDEDEDIGDEQEDEREVKATCDGCNKNLYEGDRVWGNNQIGTYCEECAEEEIAFWWDVIY
jgi:predicted sulfurtransferase